MANVFNGKAADRKVFVCIAAAKGETQQNLAICNGKTVCVSRNNVKQIQDIAERFMAGYAAPCRLSDIA